jgi:hypothetical protein
MGKSTISMAIFKFANCNSWPGRVSSLFHQFYPHLGRCFASEIPFGSWVLDPIPGPFWFPLPEGCRKRGLPEFPARFLNVFGAWESDPGRREPQISVIFHLSSSWFFEILHVFPCFWLYLLISWSSKKMPFFHGPKSQAPSQLSRVLSFFQLQSLRMGSIGSVWIIWGTRNGGFHEKNGGTLW